MMMMIMIENRNDVKIDDYDEDEEDVIISNNNSLLLLMIREITFKLIMRITKIT